MDEHPTGEVLERFLRGELDPAERRRVVDHLLGGCPKCNRDMAPLSALLLDPDLDPPEGGAAVENYDDAIDRAFAAVRFHGTRAPRVKRDRSKALERLRRNGTPRPVAARGNWRRCWSGPGSCADPIRTG